MKDLSVIVIGGGIAGISLAAELAEHCRVVVLEQEQFPSAHASGRSAAAFIPSYDCDNKALFDLTCLSLPVLQSDMGGAAEAPLLKRRGLLNIVPRGLEAAAREAFDAAHAVIPDITWIEAGHELLLKLKFAGEYAECGWLEPDVWDIDVNELLQTYLRRMRAAGGELATDRRVTGMRRHGETWVIDTAAGTYEGEVVVNCAGAWADEVARLAGARAQQLTPLRRTAILFDPPEDVHIDDWPLVYASDHSFYLKPDAGQLLASPADETPSDPVDAQPEEIDIATAAWRVEQAFDFSVHRVSHSWAGLRTFAPDRTPSIGADPDAQAFYWLAGQGGHGVQTAPAAALFLAALILELPMPAGFESVGFDPALVSPAR